MDKRELAYTKQTLTNIKDWDGFQDALRYLAKLVRGPQQTTLVVTVKKS